MSKTQLRGFTFKVEQSLVDRAQILIVVNP